MLLSYRTSSCSVHGANAHQPRCTPKCVTPGAQLKRTCKASRSRSTHLKVQAIGFDFGDKQDTASYSGFTTARAQQKQSKLKSAGYLSSQLLMYYSIPQSTIGQSFLSLAALLFKASASNKDIIEAYSGFYQKLALSGYDSWEDFILDQILLGRDNPFARSVAQGDLKGDAPLRAAAAHDLDVLQQLAISQQQLLQYVSTAVPTTSDSYIEAGESVSLKSHEFRALPSSSPYAFPIDTSHPFLQGPLSTEELGHWKSAIASKSRWSQALPLIQQYYENNGYGLTSRNAALRWKAGALEEASEGVLEEAVVDIYKEQRTKLVANTLRHLEGKPAQHALLCGASGSGKSMMMWEEQLRIGREKGLRLVEISASEVGSIVEAARGCGRYPRVRFILVADHVDLPLSGAAGRDLMGALEGRGGAGWPSNVLLYLGASPTCSLSYSDPLISRFGMVLVFDEMTSPKFNEAVAQLAGSYGVAAGLDPAQGAEEWAKAHGGMSIRTARQWVQQLAV